MWKKLAKTSGYLLFLSVSVLLLLEGTFRWYIVDFYRHNLIALNSSEGLQAKAKATILVVGDSFSADQNSYVKHLRDSLSDYRVINAAIPGTCIRQHDLFLKSRIREFQPEILIYQVYVGNDLLEFRHPTESPSISIVRKAYWWMADHFLVLAYINSRLPYLKHWLANDVPQVSDAKLEESFAPERYSSRTKMLLKAEPDLLTNSILLQEARQEDMLNFSQKLASAIKTVPENCKIYLLLMPHAIQVSKTYQERFQRLGAKLIQPDSLLVSNYPFARYLENQIKEKPIRFVNPLPRLQEKNQTFSVYYDNDPHLNPEGQEVVGHLLLEILSSESSQVEEDQ